MSVTVTTLSAIFVAPIRAPPPQFLACGPALADGGI